MKRGFRRIAALLTAILLMAAAVPLPASAVAPGTPIGWVLYSDVVAYIDGFPIRSYNIDGNTYVVAEDLMDYGFGVTWDGSTSRLIISEQRTATPSGYTSRYVPVRSPYAPGTPAMQYLYTNVTVWIGRAQIAGYNIGGYTCVAMDDLAARFGIGYTWDPLTSSLRLRTSDEEGAVNMSAMGLRPLPETEYWGYRYLVGQPSDAYIWAYEQIRSGLAARRDQIWLTNQKHRFTPEALKQVFNIVRSDHPELFWVSNSYSYSYSETADGTRIVLNITPRYLCTADELPALKENFEYATQKLLSGVTAAMSDFDKELTVHDNLVNFAQYDEATDGEWIYTAYGAIALGSCVCDGYARAFQYLLYRCGIEAIYVTGTTNRDASHAWNIVKIDGEHYYVDVTWDDPAGGDPMLRHDYFNVPSVYLELDHTPEAEYYSIPYCRSWEANYFNRFGYVAYLTLDSIETVLARQAGHVRGDYFEIYIYPEGCTADEASAFCSENVGELCRFLCPIYGVEYHTGLHLWHTLSRNGRIFRLRMSW